MHSSLSRFRLVKTPLHIGLQRIAHVLVDSREIEPVRIEISSAPLLGFIVFQVARVRQDFKKPLIAGYPAD